MRIIVAEDDAVSRARLTAVLEGMGHEPRAFENGQEAWAAFDEEPTRVVISDWEMPGCDGLELCRRVRQRKETPYTYFILATAARTDDKSYTWAIEADVDDFLVKPLRRDALWRRLHVAERILRFTQEIQQLQQLMPICMYCKRIRDDRDYWHQIETYIQAHTGSSFSHGVCPECVAHMRREFQLDEK